VSQAKAKAKKIGPSLFNLYTRIYIWTGGVEFRKNFMEGRMHDVLVVEQMRSSLFEIRICKKRDDDDDKRMKDSITIST
jgi:hypothetical protein